MDHFSNITPELVKKYKEEIAERSSAATTKRKMSSLKRFFNWARKEGHLEQNPFEQIPEVKPQPVRLPRFNLTNLFRGSIIVGSAVLIFLLVQKLQLPIPFLPVFPAEQAEPTKIEPSGEQEIAILSPWTIFAKMNLKNQANAPITTTRSITFRLYKDEDKNQSVWTSEQKQITPDTNGDILILLDDVPTELFFENEKLFLSAVTSEGEPDRLIPVSTANTAASLQGFYPSIEAGPTTIPLISENGELLLASEAPAVKATDGNLLIEGQAITISTPTGSDGNIEINPDGSGTAHFLFEGYRGNFLNAQAPNLISGSLYYGIVANNASGYNLIKLESGSPNQTRFSVDSLGNTQIAGDLNVEKDISTAETTRLTSGGKLKNITGYSQTSGNFSISQQAGSSATITKKASGLSDALTLTLDERGYSNSIYSTLKLKRYNGAIEAMALFVDEGNTRFDGQVQLGRFISNPNAIGQGTLVFNTSDTSLYIWNGTSWVNLGGGSVSSFWQRISGVLSPVTTSDDLAIGGSSTSAADIIFHADGGAVFNEQGNDADLRIEGDTDVNLFFVDAGADNIGIGDSSPDAKLEVSSSSEQLRLTHTDDTYDARFTVSNAGNLTIDVTGSYLAITDNLQVNGGDIGISTDTDLIQLASGALSVNGTLTATGNITTTGGYGSFSSYVLADYLQIQDTNDSHQLSLVWNENETVADRTLNFLVAAGDRSLTLNEDFTIGDGHAGTLTFSAASKTLTVEDDTYVNQDLTTDANPSFAGVTAGNIKVGVTGDEEIDTVSGNLTLDSAGGTVNVDDALTATGTITADGGLITRSDANLTFSTTTSGNLTLSSVGDLLFTDDNATNIPLTVSDTDLSPFPSGDRALVDALNYVREIAAGETSFSGYWQLSSNVIAPRHESVYELAVGGTSTSSATFHVGLSGDLQAGGAAADVSYSRFGTATTGHAGNLTTADDLLVSGDLEIDGVLFLDGLIIANKTLGTSTITFTDTPTTSYNSLSASSWLIENTANVGLAALMVNQTKDGDILTASASGTPKMALTNAGVLKLYNATSTISNDSGDITINAASDNISLASDNLINVNDAYFAGQVGIGTASPISKLHVDGAVVGKALAIFNETGDQAIFTASASGTTKFVIEHSGRVGINDALQVGSTTTAAYSRFGTATTGHSGNLTAADDLLISGDLEIDGVLFLDGLIIANKTLGTSTITFTDTPTTAYNTLSASSWLIENTANLGQAALMVNQTKGGDIFTASASGTPKFVIDNSGKVGIGTTNPSTALEVSGTVTATDFECDGCIDEGDLETAPDIQYVATDPNQRVTTSATYADFASQSSVTVNMGGLGTHWTFDFWVLTQMDQDGTGYLELYDVTNSQSISGSEVSFTSRSPIALSATGVTMPSSGTVTFRVRGKVPGSGSYLRLFWWAIYCRRTGAGADLAEYYRSTEPLGAGDVVAINFNEDKKINKSSQAYDPSSIGIVSSEPGMVLGNIDGTRQQSDAYPVALAGRVPVKVSLEGGVIKRGDPLTSSSVPGVAMKANSAGPIIGKAMEEFNGYSGQVMAFVNLSYYNPGVDTGDEVFDQVKITDREAGTYAIDQTGNLLGLGAWHSKLEDSSPITISEGESQAILEQLSQLGNLASKTLSAAVVNIYETLSAKEIKTFALEVTENIKAGAITARELAVDGLRAVGIKTALIETELISPVPDGNLVIDLDNSSPDASESAFGKLIVKGEGGEEVASIDAEGNARLAGDLEARQASFSGKMSSNQLAVASDATIAGELHAKKIYADEIVTSELSTVDSEQSITLEEIEELLREAEEEQSLLADSTDWNINTATDSSNLDELALNNLYVTETAAMNSLSLSQSLTIGPDLIIQSQMTDDQSLTINSIDTLSAPLKLQSLALAPLEIMAGKVRIDTDGNMQITGNLYVGGQIEASGLTLRESEQENGGPASPAGGFGKLLNLLDAEGNEIASIDASGSGQFKTVSTDKLIIAGSEATTSATLLTGLVTETNATAGKAMIPAGSREITIKNPRVTDYSLIYVTPTSSTLNNVLYVKSKNSCTEETQECKPNFVVGFNQALEVDVEFNWWIIDVTE